MFLSAPAASGRLFRFHECEETGLVMNGYRRL